MAVPVKSNKAAAIVLWREHGFPLVFDMSGIFYPLTQAFVANKVSVETIRSPQLLSIASSHSKQDEAIPSLDSVL